MTNKFFSVQQVDVIETPTFIELKPNSNGSSFINFDNVESVVPMSKSDNLLYIWPLSHEDEFYTIRFGSGEKMCVVKTPDLYEALRYDRGL